MVQESKVAIASRARFALVSILVAIACAMCGIAFSGELAYAATSKQTTTSSAASVKAGWQKSGSIWKYRYANGTYAKGIKKIGKSTYCFDDNGRMKTGWQKVSGKWYLFGSSGAMQKGWQKSGGAWYFLNSNGTMKKGWLTQGGKKYYLKSSGAMSTGWQKISGKWYCFDGSGAMQKSKWVGNYWLKSNGVMATSSWVDGGKYYVDKNGKWVSGKRGTGITSASDKALAKKMAGVWVFDMGQGMISYSLGNVKIYEDGRICDKTWYMSSKGRSPLISEYNNPKDRWWKVGSTKNGIMTIKTSYGWTYTYDSKADTFNGYVRPDKYESK